MNKDFLALFFQKTAFPQAAAAELTRQADALATELDRLVAVYEAAYDHATTNKLVEACAKRTGHSAYAIWLLVIALAAEKVLPLYRSEKHFWDTFCDLRYKAQECYDVHGIWGTFVAHWYPIFFNGTIVKLGRMEYQVKPCPLPQPQSAFGFTVNPGDPVLFLHIPSSGEPFDSATRLDSYRQAWQHFCPDGRPLICICNSWLLLPEYEGLFTPGSNIDAFRREFAIISSKPETTFSNGWRVFGHDHTLPPEQLPENTSIQRAFKAYLQAGGTHGNGMGVLIFDGETILTQRRDLA